ncbi:hypothetical protein GIB67_000505 [Kingdonia uniflora]|uniref:Trs120/TRAPPC9 third Ig-like domain-containing protein n=1 Tax=Kingdonia uniflora TaxID=39325 RepID=A0A7J7L0F7_9MAGN|nr:hypothetical protein GIB67_000505 [Kingdonia uniflora]
MLERFAYILIFGFLLLKANNFVDRRELAKEVVELLMTAPDGAKFLIDASDLLILYVEIARLFGMLGYPRNAAFFLGQVAQLYLQQEDCLSAKSLQMCHVVGCDGAVILYEGEIRNVWICLANVGSVPVEQAHLSLLGKNQDPVISIAYDTLKIALPLKLGAEVTLLVTIKGWQLACVDPDSATGKSSFGSMTMAPPKEGSSPMLVIHYAGPVTQPEQSSSNGPSMPPGRRLVIPLQVCVLQGLSFVKARLLSMEIPAHVNETLPKPMFSESGNTKKIATFASRPDCMVKIDPYRGSYSLRLLKLELSNPTDVVFEISVSVQIESPKNEDTTFIDRDATDFRYPKTRIDRDFFARVLIPLGHFKLPILDRSFLSKDCQTSEVLTSRTSSFSEKNMKAELNASIKSLISRIKVRWKSGRDSSGELNIKNAIHVALQTSVMVILLPDPLTFGFKLATIDSSKDSNTDENLPRSKGSIFVHEMTPMEVLVRINAREMITVNLNITCKDVAGENCIKGNKATVIWSGKIFNHCTVVSIGINSFLDDCFGLCFIDLIQTIFISYFL